jgi:hypothetical protein
MDAGEMMRLGVSAETYVRAYVRAVSMKVFLEMG